MKILIQGATIIDPRSPYHGQEKNVLLRDGSIASINEKNPQADLQIKAKGMILSPGWFDLGTFIGDPGLEQKEDQHSAMLSGAAGGFTGLAMLPNTNPSIHLKNDVSYVLADNQRRLVQLYPIASVTRANKGEELTEMIDLFKSGAVAFSDGLKPIWHTDIFLKALQYLQPINGLLIDRPEDIWLNLFGQMHEGVTSTMLGLKGMPRLAEELAIKKDLELLEYAGGRLHLSRISSGRSVDLIKSAKKKMQLTCDIAAYQPLLDDKCLGTFDTNYKTNPPLREKQDNESLLKGLKDGTIDVICSGHTPQEDESKETEFDLAEFGIINLQTFGANLLELSKSVDWEVLIPKVTSAPRALLGIEQPAIEADSSANLTLFDPQATWTLDEQTNRSKSRNSPWWRRSLTGQVKAVFNNHLYWLNEAK